MKSAIQIPNSSLRLRSGQARRTGFTLLELLIAMGILAVGGAMVAALFPAAIKENTSSYNDTLGSIICENGLATVKAMYVNDNTAANGIGNSSNLRYFQSPGGSFTFSCPVINSMPGYLGVISHYPSNEPINANAPTLGFLCLGRQVSAGANDYQFVLVAYKNINNGTQDTQLVPLSGTLVKPTTTITTDLITNISPAISNNMLGSPVIIDSAGVTCGEYATVKAVSGSSLILDRELTTAAGSVNFWVLTESSTTRSPAMNVLVTRTALRDQ